MLSFVKKHSEVFIKFPTMLFALFAQENIGTIEFPSIELFIKLYVQRQEEEKMLISKIC